MLTLHQVVNDLSVAWRHHIYDIAEGPTGKVGIMKFVLTNR